MSWGDRACAAATIIVLTANAILATALITLTLWGKP